MQQYLQRQLVKGVNESYRLKNSKVYVQRQLIFYDRYANQDMLTVCCQNLKGFKRRGDWKFRKMNIDYSPISAEQKNYDSDILPFGE